MSDPFDDALLKPREVAEMLGVHTATVTLWVRIGRLKPSVVTPGGHRRYRRVDVRAFGDAEGLMAATPERVRMEVDAVRLYEQGWSIRQVAARFGCGYGRMRRILLRHTELRSRSGERR
jgi:excisionase family DNA binding protein